MGRAHRAVSVIFLMHGALLGVWATQIPLVKERLGIDTAILGLALLCSALGGMAAMQVAPPLTRWLGEAALLRASMVLACLTLPLAALAGNRWWLGIALLLFGAGFGLVDLVMNAQAGEVERRSERPIMSALHGMWSLGGLGGAALGSLLLALLSPAWQVGLFSAAATILVLLASRALLAAAGSAGEAHPARIAGLAWQPALMLIGVLMALAFAVEGALADWSAVYLREAHRLPPSRAGLGYAGFAATMLLGRLSGDRVRARWGDRLVLRMAALSGLLLLAAVLSPDPWIAIVGFALCGVTLCNAAPILFNAAGRLGGAQGPGGATQAVATAVSFGYAGVMAAPPLIGFVARQSSLRAAFCVAACGCLLLGLGAQRLPRDSRHRAR